jgi:23S rRNA (cytidine1920-2'-O)/16S rRNA (cytidine1409-2'-O)-methyltransferase
MSKKTRVDVLLVDRGLVESRSLAQRLVMAGQVRADGQVVSKSSNKVAANVTLTIDHGPRFVSRGGDKLAAAFESFDLDVTGKICADVGASTGGFTDCLLQNGSEKVYAIDVGKGILHWKMRKHPRVAVMEGTNARYVAELPEPIKFVTIDASFISLKILLPVILNWGKTFDVLALIKPQFEAGRKQVARGKGVVRDPEIHRQVLLEILAFAVAAGYELKGLGKSPVLGPKGNVEFLGWLSFPKRDPTAEISISDIVATVVQIPEIDE